MPIPKPFKFTNETVISYNSLRYSPIDQGLNIQNKALAKALESKELSDKFALAFTPKSKNSTITEFETKLGASKGFARYQDGVAEEPPKNYTTFSGSTSLGYKFSKDIKSNTTFSGFWGQYENPGKDPSIATSLGLGQTYNLDNKKYAGKVGLQYNTAKFTYMDGENNKAGTQRFKTDYSVDASYTDKKKKDTFGAGFSHMDVEKIGVDNKTIYGYEQSSAKLSYNTLSVIGTKSSYTSSKGNQETQSVVLNKSYSTKGFKGNVGAGIQNIKINDEKSQTIGTLNADASYKFKNTTLLANAGTTTDLKNYCVGAGAEYTKGKFTVGGNLKYTNNEFENMTSLTPTTGFSGGASLKYKF